MRLSYGNLFGTERCTGYADGGYCHSNAIEYEDPENVPLDPSCQTHSGTVGPLSSDQANQSTMEYQRARSIEGAIPSAALGALTVLATNGFSVPTQLFTGLGVTFGQIAASFPTEDDFPFRTGDTITWTLSACNNGRGGVNTDINFSVNRG